MDKKYYIRNQETWELEEVSKECYDRYQNAIEMFRPKVNGIKGTIQIIGTMSDEDSGDFKNTFYSLIDKEKP